VGKWPADNCVEITADPTIYLISLDPT